MSGSEEKVNAAIVLGVNINIKDADGWTGLLWSIVRKHENISGAKKTRKMTSFVNSLRVNGSTDHLPSWMFLEVCLVRVYFVENQL